MCFRKFCIRIERFFFYSTCKYILMFSSYKSSAFTGFNMLKIYNNMRSPIDFKCNTFSKITCLNHKYIALSLYLNNYQTLLRFYSIYYTKLCDDCQVLNANSEFIRYIYSGLHGNRHKFFQYFFTSGV